MTRAATDITSIETDLVAALRVIREALQPVDGTPQDDALTHVESFCSVALRVMKKTNPSKIRDCARTEEIKARMDGRAVDDRAVDAA